MTAPLGRGIAASPWGRSGGVAPFDQLHASDESATKGFSFWKIEMNEYLYVVEFDSGIVKVGRGMRAQPRIRAAEVVGAIAGWTKLNQFIVECQGAANAAEQSLIRYAAQHSTERRAREWFLGCSFNSLKDEAKKLASAEAAPIKRKDGWGEYSITQWLRGNTRISDAFGKASLLEMYASEYGTYKLTAHGIDMFVVTDENPTSPYIKLYTAYFAHTGDTTVLDKAVSDGFITEDDVINSLSAVIEFAKKVVV